MSNAAVLVPAMAVLLAASACFTAPLGTPGGVPLDATLVNEWHCKSADIGSGDHALLSVVRFDSEQYYAEWNEGDKRERYRVYPVRLAGVTVLNVENLVATDWHWQVVRYSFPEDGKLNIQLPSKRIFDMSDEKAAVQELRANADKPETWQPFARCELSKDGA